MDVHIVLHIHGGDGAVCDLAVYYDRAEAVVARDAFLRTCVQCGDNPGAEVIRLPVVGGALGDVCLLRMMALLDAPMNEVSGRVLLSLYDVYSRERDAIVGPVLAPEEFP